MEWLTRLIFPARCPGCGQSVPSHGDAMARSGIPGCWMAATAPWPAVIALPSIGVPCAACCSSSNITVP